MLRCGADQSVKFFENNIYAVFPSLASVFNKIENEQKLENKLLAKVPVSQ